MKELKFHIGDKVRVLSGNGGFIWPGDVETIKAIAVKTTEIIRENKTTKSTKVYYLLRHDYQCGNKFMEGQLEKVEEEQ